MRVPNLSLWNIRDLGVESGGVRGGEAHRIWRRRRVPLPVHRAVPPAFLPLSAPSEHLCADTGAPWDRGVDSKAPWVGSGFGEGLRMRKDGKWAHWISSCRNATAWISAALVVFRCDIAVFAAPLGVYWLFTGQLSLGRGLTIGVATTIAALVVSVPLDSFLWGRLIWPELEVFSFNFIENEGSNSSAWGTSPALWYFLNALPRYPLRRRCKACVPWRGL